VWQDGEWHTLIVEPAMCGDVMDNEFLAHVDAHAVLFTSWLKASIMRRIPSW